MQKILAAIKSYWDGASSLSSTVGSLYLGVAAQGATAPYAVYTVITAPSTSKYGGVSYSEPLIQFTVRGAGSASAGANAALVKAELVMAAMDEHAFSLSGSQHMNILRIGEPIPEPQDPTAQESGFDTFGWILQYQLSVA
jgi:hypothetical protein